MCRVFCQVGDMSISGGMFSIIQQGQINTAAAAHSRAPMVIGGSTNPLTWSLKKSESAIQAYWRLAPDAAARNAPSVDVVKRLEKLAAGDNKEISAEKLRQAKARLAALRQQIQLAAASSDSRQIKRLAAEAAQLAREVGMAARHLAQGVAAGTDSYGSDGAADHSGTANAVAQATVTREAVFQSLHAIGNDARNAITEAKGIVALAAQMARARRKSSEQDDDDSFFRRLQDMLDDALADVDFGQRAALGQLVLPPDTGGTATVTRIELSITSTTLVSEYA
jgi:hypothetical protein